MAKTQIRGTPKITAQLNAGRRPGASDNSPSSEESIEKWKAIGESLELDDHVNERLHEQARQAFVHGDAVRLLGLADRNSLQLSLVTVIKHELRERGVYEEALLHAFVSTATNHHEMELDTIDYLFELADRDKLLAAGDPLPIGESFTVYRGVAGIRRHRRVEGYSWTLNLSQACYFAARFDRPNGRVYQATVARVEVLAYINWRDEAEVICRPKGIHNRRLTHREIAAAAEEFNIKRAQQREAAKHRHKSILDRKCEIKNAHPRKSTLLGDWSGCAKNDG